MMRNYESLTVWAKAHELCLEVYAATKAFPPWELYGLGQQIRSAAASVPSNIAEGCGRTTDAELLRFTDIAMGSANEVHYQLRLSRDLGYVGAEEHARLAGLAAEVRRLGAGYQAHLRRKLATHRGQPPNASQRLSSSDI